MIDTHAHLDFENFDEDREEVISRAFDNGVKKIINIGVDLGRSRKSIEIAKKHKNIYASAGLHPDFFSFTEKEFPISNFQFLNKSQILNSKFKNIIEELKKIAMHEKVVAIGEAGLDYFHITHSMKHGARELEKIKENQKKGFLAQINLAKELGLPVVVHCREAWDDLFDIISNFSQNLAFSFRKLNFRNSLKFSFPKFVLHCYSGEKKDTEKFLKLPNVYFSFSGNITYPKPVERAEKLAEAVRMIPLDKIMLDSDSPFLAPQEFRGKRNEPAHVRYIAEKIAEIKEISEEEVEKATDENAEKFFSIW